MKRCFLTICAALCLFVLSPPAFAQGNQNVTNGGTTAPVNFPAGGCTYNWTNSNPSIGLPASGTGNIPAFTAINTDVNTATGTITATPVSANGFAYITNSSSGNVSVIDINADKVVATIPVGNSPVGVAISADGTRVYVTNQGGGGSPSVSVIDAATNKVIATIPMPADSQPTGIVITPDGKTLYVSDYNIGSVSVINTTTNTITGTITVGSFPDQMVMSPDGSTLYVANPNSYNISVIKTSSNAVIASIPLTLAPIGITLSPDGKTLYAELANSNNVVAINTSNYTITGTATVGNNPGSSAITPNGSFLYVSNGYDNTVSVVNTANNATIATIQLGHEAYSVDVSRDGSKVYVTLPGVASIAVISTQTNSVITTIPVGLSPTPLGNFVGGCPLVTFTVAVASDPDGSFPAITATPATGTISACVGSASASPNIEQFTVSGSNLTGAISAKAPPGFEISLNPNSTYGSNVSLPETNGITNSTTLYIRSAAADPSGNISGNVVLSSPGAGNQNVSVTGMVNALPTVNPLPNQTVNAGAATAVINFTGTGNTFTWTNDNPSIGLPVSGTGNIASFVAANNGNLPVTAKITVTPTIAPAAYVPNTFGSDVSVINTSTGNLITTIGVGYSPWGVTISPDQSKVYITNGNSGTVSVISTASNTVIATIPVDKGSSGIVITPDGGKLYVANTSANSISVISTLNNSVIKTIPVDANPTQMTISPDGSAVYVTNYQSGTVSVINTANDIIKTSISLARGAQGITVSADGKTLYVTNDQQSTLTVINTTTYATIATIPVGPASTAVALGANGAFAYVTDSGNGVVSVINTSTNLIVATIPVGSTPYGICASPDGSLIYVVNAASNNVSVINTASNKVVTTLTAGLVPFSFGKFVTSGVLCPGTPTTFTITVNPPPPSITASTPTGTISACQGSPSESPNIEQFTLSGTNLTGNITITAPPGFEVSVDGKYFSNPWIIVQQSGSVPATTIYVRSSATASGNIAGNIILSSPGATDQAVAVTGTINALPTVNAIANQTVANGSSTTAINFSGTATSFNWTIDAPGIGLAASGTGNIAPLAAINTTAAPVTATVTVTPSNTTTGCTGTPVSFTITVNPPPPPSFGVTANLSGLTTTYGTSSSPETFTISGTDLTADLSVTAPPGFEVSTDGTNFSAAVSINTGGKLTSAAVSIRLAATTPAGAYSGNIVLSSTGTTNVNLAMPNSTVSKALLVITANDQTKSSGTPNPELTVSYNGFVNGENQDVLTTLPVATTTATTSSGPGQYVISVDGAKSPNYNFSYVSGTLTVLPSLQSAAIPNAFTPNGDGVNDVWNIPQLTDFPNCVVSIYTRYGSLVFQLKGYGKPWDGNFNGSPVPAGTYYYVIDPRQESIRPLTGYVAVLR